MNDKVGYGLRLSDAEVLAAANEQLRAEIARLKADKAELVSACRALLMCSLPNDISGRRMVDEAREIFARHFNG